MLVMLAVCVGLMSTATAAPAIARDTPWVAPVGSSQQPQVLAGFDPPEQQWLAGHRGVDLAATTGSVVRAAGAGSVTFAGQLAGRGVVTVTHGELRTTYEPVDSIVGVGARVAAGQIIGTVGSGGHCDLRCVHWGLLRGQEYLDPLLLLSWRPPVLKSPKSGSQASARSERRGTAAATEPKTRASTAPADQAAPVSPKSPRQEQHPAPQTRSAQERAEQSHAVRSSPANEESQNIEHQSAALIGVAAAGITSSAVVVQQARRRRR